MYSILITGGCGFIGSNFINNYFYKVNLHIINLDNLYYCASVDNVKNEIRNSDRYTFIKGNICSIDLINNIIDNFKIKYVLHMAAQTHVQNSFENSLQFTNDNVLGTHVLLECFRKSKILKKFIHVSTDEVYGDLNYDKDRNIENSILCPSNPYAATKAAAELIAQSYIKSFNMPIIITRGNNVYGPKQYPEKIIPKFISFLKQNKKVTIQGTGENLRSYLHVYDVCNAFEIIINKGKIGEIYNIGSDENNEFSVLDIAKILIKKIKKTEKYDDWIEYIEDRPYNDKRYYISNKKLKNLGWDTTVNFLKGINNLI